MRHSRRYSLFERKNGKWEQISNLHLPLEHARRYWQDALLQPLLVSGSCNERSLRAVARKQDS